MLRSLSDERRRRPARVPCKLASLGCGWSEERATLLRDRCLEFARRNRQRVIAQARRGEDLGFGGIVRAAAGDDFDVDALIDLEESIKLEQDMLRAALDADGPECCLEEELQLQLQMEQWENAESEELAYLASLHDA
eukprot:TRINITY_DN6657_c0_g1_i1.p1 TRINITY_DN6657_c0_g1~~TRINITY_DN6657_c0_g1_i1.p1  ORF type:complete len:137 (+),score=40.67 TRINITY_DN6657_c0_g1_i1:76-486(+)